MANIPHLKKGERLSHKWTNEVADQLSPLSQIKVNNGLSIIQSKQGVVISGNSRAMQMFLLTEDIKMPDLTRTSGSATEPDCPWAENCEYVLLSNTEYKHHSGTQEKVTIYFPGNSSGFTGTPGGTTLVCTQPRAKKDARIWAIFNTHSGRWEEFSGGGGNDTPGFIPFKNTEAHATSGLNANFVPPYGCVMNVPGCEGTSDPGWKLKIGAPDTRWEPLCFINDGNTVAPNHYGLACDGSNGAIKALAWFPSWMDALDTNGDRVVPEDYLTGMELGPTMPSTGDPEQREWHLIPSYPSVCTLIKRLYNADFGNYQTSTNFWICEVLFHPLRCGPMITAQSLQNVYRDDITFEVNYVRVAGQQLGCSPTMFTNQDTFTIFNQGWDTSPPSGKTVNLGFEIVAFHNLRAHIHTKLPLGTGPEIPPSYGTYQLLDAGCGLYFR